ncbi:hypothetical protein [Konateibacter massiliensis]|uniref:hypothetical protein n=1 Tax=Konateibacter massiliensis TaxID=2002841 RepID=UPI000C14F752|nr:hypothetical protein [Konateibacter massiliensis]
MLGKLIKYEFKAVSKILGILHIALFLVTLAGVIAISLSKNTRFDYITTLTLALYIVILIAVAAAVTIYIVVRFYRNLFTDEGYLMNTLPVKSYELICSKLVVGFTWVIINAICTLISIFVLVCSQISSVPDFAEGLGYFKEIMLTEFGLSLPGLILFIVIGSIISVFYMLIMFYTSIAIGQTMRNHKVLFSLGAYVALYIISQIISSVSMVPFGFITILQAETDNASSITSAFGPMMILSYVVSFALAMVYFFITNHIIGKKLNLE